MEVQGFNLEEKTEDNGQVGDVGRTEEGKLEKKVERLAGVDGGLGDVGGEGRGMQEEVLTGEAIGGDGQKDVHVNLERGLVVHGAIGDGSSGEEEDEFDFGDGDGHSDREYPEEDLDAEEMRYGVELRTSPFKGVMGRQLVTFQAALAVRRGLNYSGAQKEKVASFTGSSNQRARVERRSGFSGGGHDGGGDPSAQSSLPRETKEVLSRQVEDMVVDESLPDLSKAADDVSKRNNDRVPGLNSYMGSSEGYRSTGASPKVSLHARQQWAKKAGCDGSQRKDHVKSPRVVVEIQKQKKSKTSHNPNVLVETLNSLGVEVQHGDLGMGDVAAATDAGEQEDVLHTGAAAVQREDDDVLHTGGRRLARGGGRRGAHGRLPPCWGRMTTCCTWEADARRVTVEEDGREGAAAAWGAGSKAPGSLRASGIQSGRRER
nr:unnamed protein product [Digitaria exilis]